MTRARLVMQVSLKWIQDQVPDGSPAELVDFALHHVTMYGSFAGNRSPNESPETKAWYHEAKEKNLKLIADQFPDLADECDRQLKALVT